MKCRLHVRCSDLAGDFSGSLEGLRDGLPEVSQIAAGQNSIPSLPQLHLHPHLGSSDLSLRMHYSRRTGFILVVMI